MACNCPIVATDVGDIKLVFRNTEGCYLTAFDTNDVAEKLKKAIDFDRTKGSIQGRERIIELGLDLENVARKIITVYNKVLKIEKN
jgi:glycosyltransferase involved in cell wall biosynthesis